MNIIRKRLSAVKGGRFAKLCAPAGVIGLILSDVLGDAPETIASGPITPDPTTALQAEQTLLRVLPDAPRSPARAHAPRKRPKTLSNSETHIIGGIGQLVRAATRELQTARL